MNSYQKRRLARLLQHIDRANEVIARDHSRPQEGLPDSYAYDFGALQASVEQIAAEARELSGAVGVEAVTS